MLTGASSNGQYNSNAGAAAGRVGFQSGVSAPQPVGNEIGEQLVAQEKCCQLLVDAVTMLEERICAVLYGEPPSTATPEPSLPGCVTRVATAIQHNTLTLASAVQRLQSIRERVAL